MSGVQQLDPKGCGVAAVATVCGMSYGLVRDHALETATWRASYGMSGGMMARLLQRLGKPVRVITMGRVPSQPIIGRTAIVKVTGEVACEIWRNGKPEKRRRLWQHWVVWQQGKVWDPGYGTLWDGEGVTGGGMRLYLASVRSNTDVKVRKVRTGRWHWL